MLDHYLNSVGFTDDLSERQSQLELALQSIFWNENVRLDYGDTFKVKTPVYILPVDFANDFLWGFFFMNGKFLETPIGFRHTIEFSRSDSYHINTDGKLVKATPEEDVLYLPLRTTQWKASVRKTLGGISRVGLAQMPVFGLSGSTYASPLVLYFESEQGPMLKGLCHNHESKPDIYDEDIHQIGQERLRQIISTLRLNQYAHILRSTASPPCAKAPVAAKQQPHLTQKQSTPVMKGRGLADKCGIDWLRPKSIVHFLDQYVIGQHEAKKKVAVAFSNYMTQYLEANRTKGSADSSPLLKNHLLLMGPSGVGKTYMVSLLAKQASLPMGFMKLTGKTSEGYKGQNPSTVFKQIIAQTNDPQPFGVVFLDEIDKLVANQGGPSNSFGPVIQNSLIGWMDEDIIEFDSVGSEKNHSINTKNLLFVTAGAFTGIDGHDSLEDIVSRRLNLNPPSVIGFSSKGFADTVDTPKGCMRTNLLAGLKEDDLLRYGFRSELIGRLPYRAVLDHLTVEDKIRVLTEAKDSVLYQYQALFRSKGYELVVSKSVPQLIAERSPEETGARGLNLVCNDIFTEILYEVEKYDTDGVIKLTPRLVDSLIGGQVRHIGGGEDA